MIGILILAEEAAVIRNQNEYENYPTTPAPDLYCPWYITYDKNLFERGLRGTIRMHGAWPDARRTEDGAAGIRDGTTTR